MRFLRQLSSYINSIKIEMDFVNFQFPGIYALLFANLIFVICFICETVAVKYVEEYRNEGLGSCMKKARRSFSIHKLGDFFFF